MRVPLQRVAHVRSGDKGDTSNITVIAYEAALFAPLAAQLTAERFGAHHAGLITGEVTRYMIEPLWALNFVARGALGGGVSRSLRIDNYGKALSSAILSFELEIPDGLAGLLRGPASG